VTGEKTFLLGTGAQKGGTTWLFRYLKESPQYVRGYMKEYHVFDALDLPSEERARNTIFRRATDALESARAGAPTDARFLHRLSMYGNPNLYYDYFSGLLATRPGGRVTADMTPEYGMLPVARFRDIRNGFAERGVRAAAILLMRDPVERVWSHIRMRAQRRPETFDRPLHEVLLNDHSDPNYAQRTRYDRTIAALDEVFDQADVHYGFYETLFTESSIKEICEFAGIDYLSPDFDRQRNVSERPAAPVPESTVREVATSYRAVYEAVAARFPDVDVEELWPNARLAL
jgi:hypothetical protein